MKEQHLYILGGVFIALLIIFIIVDFATKPKSVADNIEDLIQTVIFGVSNEDISEIEVYKQTAGKEIKMNFVKEVLVKGSKKTSIINKEGIEVDFRFCDKNSFGGHLQYFTGDKQHNIWLRKIAIKKGYKLNEYGLFDKKTNQQIAGKTESEIYKKLNLKMPSPEDRVGETK